jgi:SAM-dependent methyltransferase
MPNSEEIAYWNDEAGSRWATFQERIDHVLAPLGAAGLASAALQPAEAVLDIGCGCGATLLELANAVGAKGSVVGVDVSQSMLAVAEQRAQGLGLANVRCVLADASTYAFGEAAFDLAFSRFGVMFFDDPVGAFANVRRSLRADGRLVFVCWRDLAANPWFHVPLEAVRPHVAAQPKPDPEAPGPLAFADPNRVRAILEHAGFEDVQFEAFDARLTLGLGPRACELLSQIGPASRLLAGADDRARADAVVALDRALSAHETDGGVVLGGGVWIVSARPLPRPSRSAGESPPPQVRV